MTLRLLTRRSFGVSKLLKEAALALLTLHLTKYHIVGNVSRLIYRLLLYFQINFLFLKIISEIQSECQTVWIHIWVQLFAKDISRRQLSGAILDVSLGSFIFMDHDNVQYSTHTNILYLSTATFKSVWNPKTISNCQTAAYFSLRKIQPKKSYNKTIDAFFFS